MSEIPSNPPTSESSQSPDRSQLNDTNASDVQSDELPQRHPIYYSRDKIRLKVEDKNFSIEKTLLCECDIFRDMFEGASAHNTDSTEGLITGNPIVLQGVTKFQMESLVKILDAPWFKGPAELRTREWIAVLHLSTMWEFAQLRSLALSQIEDLELPTIQVILLAAKCCVEHWLKPAYTDLCRRATPLTAEEGSILGLPLFAALCKIREIRKDNNKICRRCEICARCGNDQKKNPCTCSQEGWVSEEVDRIAPDILWPLFPSTPEHHRIWAEVANGKALLIGYEENQVKPNLASDDSKPRDDTISDASANTATSRNGFKGIVVSEKPSGSPAVPQITKPNDETKTQETLTTEAAFSGNFTFEMDINDSQVVVKVSNTLYRLKQRTLLQFKSLRYNTLEKNSDEQPLELEGVTCFEIESTLCILDARWFKGEPSLTAEQWKAILRMTSLWDFAELRKVTVEKIGSMNFPPMESIILAREYQVQEWLKPAYVALCTRETPLTAEEGALLGVDFFAGLTEIREQLLKSFISSRMCSRLGCKCCHSYKNIRAEDMFKKKSATSAVTQFLISRNRTIRKM
ncbi:hypothetical protein FRC03_003652 [Tulasnella sp. 419]|nr:hypothetical protein FRC03_003652 [Tulasnella sp. 419]